MRYLSDPSSPAASKSLAMSSELTKLLYPYFDGPVPCQIVIIVTLDTKTSLETNTNILSFVGDSALKIR